MRIQLWVLWKKPDEPCFVVPKWRKSVGQLTWILIFTVGSTGTGHRLFTNPTTCLVHSLRKFHIGKDRQRGMYEPHSEIWSDWD